MRQLAYYDTLTGIPNRYFFEEKLNSYLKNAHETGEKVSILFLDLNKFKMINDAYGHAQGDQLLVEVANRLKKCIDDKGVIGRIGGDEFTICIPEMKDTGELIDLVNQISQTMSEPLVWNNQETFIDVSIGVSVSPDDGNHSQELIRKADAAMYLAKRQGKAYSFHKEDMVEKGLSKLAISNGLHKALENNEFILYYQPIVDATTGEVNRLEALLRWKPEGYEMIPPGQFIPLAEETGLIVPIGSWILKTVCNQIKDWQGSGKEPVKIAVNLSARQFIDESLIDHLSILLQETEIDPKYLELEVTESISLNPNQYVIEILERIRSLGLDVSIDDFGTGHSSLKYLKDYPINTIKIDQSFVRNVWKDKKNAMIVRSVIGMAEGLGCKVIAEGVETIEELKFLKEIGCNYYQGFYFAKPMPIKEVY